MKTIIKKFIVIIALISLVLLWPATCYAAIEIRYVNAWQGCGAPYCSPTKIFYGKTVAQLIYEEAVDHNINPLLILVILQRESSGITRSTPSSDNTRAWPMFYGYHESMAACFYGNESACNNTAYEQRAIDFGRVGQQIAYATAQFRNISNNYCSSKVVSVDGQSITTDNNESCALYKYTPHFVAYDTNSNFYKYWKEWSGGANPYNGDYSTTNIISPDNFHSLTMSAEEINNFLISKGSWLANYVIPEYVSVPYPAVASSPPPPPPPPPRKSGDVNRDNAVDLLDLSLIAGYWGKNNGDADLNSDGTVDLLDLSILAANWGH